VTLAEVVIIGAGTVGSVLARGLRKAGLAVKLRPLRRGLPKQRVEADLVVLAVRDDEIAQVADRLASAGLLGHRRRTVGVVHCAGALGPEVLATLRAPRVAVAQMHPLLSFADRQAPPQLRGGYVHVTGDRAACRLATQACRALEMKSVTIEGFDLVLYHAAAALLANGAVALVGSAQAALETAGADPDLAGAMLAPLLRSVAENVARLGLPAALTGPVRRGDLGAVRAHLARLSAKTPGQVALYQVLTTAQVPLARALAAASSESPNEGAAEKYDAIAQLLSDPR